MRLFQTFEDGYEDILRFSVMHTEETPRVVVEEHGQCRDQNILLPLRDFRRTYPVEMGLEIKGYLLEHYSNPDLFTGTHERSVIRRIMYSAAYVFWLERGQFVPDREAEFLTQYAVVMLETRRTEHLAAHPWHELKGPLAQAFGEYVLDRFESLERERLKYQKR